jgi:hypothetical protein
MFVTMRALITLVLLAALGACGARGVRGDAEAAEPAALTGRFNAESDTAFSLTGGVAIAQDGMAFDKGAMLATRSAGVRHGWELISRNGDSYAAAAIGPGTMTIELRRISSSQALSGAPNLCGERTPSYVAVAYEAQRSNVTLLVFTGDEEPGAEATRSSLCGVFGYSAPTGARTREGVVLY